MPDESADRWYRQCMGGGVVEGAMTNFSLRFASAAAKRYTDAEINDYIGAKRRGFAWRPPLRMTLRARASHPIARPDAPEADDMALRGTAGFGFWNAPFMLAQRVGRLPDAVWFLYASPPSQLSLMPEVPGWGWKAQVVHAQRWGAVASALPTLAAMAWARLSNNDRPAARWVQRLSGTHEALLTADLAAWHTYRLDWQREQATFFVDEAIVYTVPHPPQGPLGFVAWIDNQYAIVTPRGAFRSGVLQTGPQSLELADLAITPLT